MTSVVVLVCASGRGQCNGESGVIGGGGCTGAAVASGKAVLVSLLPPNVVNIVVAVTQRVAVNITLQENGTGVGVGDMQTAQIGHTGHVWPGRPSAGGGDEDGATSLPQTPNNELQPLPQYVSASPQKPCAEQHFPQVDPAHVFPMVPPQVPSVLAVRFPPTLMEEEGDWPQARAQRSSAFVKNNDCQDL
ncbi:hypothetical protein SPI_08216 [Niveomyces insectorum RCEF 264]|uniref:Uncharacterized protein n=1 Tax=Niveomyces insectorum RCEF 264 TaxID=1081102 RepID=A0A167NGI0_9HYPO|nr:hypothetical protein SPI_08216 [Niveomyces insectorum RCEF 264]